MKFTMWGKYTYVMRPVGEEIVRLQEGLWSDEKHGILEYGRFESKSTVFGEDKRIGYFGDHLMNGKGWDKNDGYGTYKEGYLTGPKGS